MDQKQVDEIQTIARKLETEDFMTPPISKILASTVLIKTRAANDPKRQIAWIEETIHTINEVLAQELQRDRFLKSLNKELRERLASLNVEIDANQPTTPDIDPEKLPVGKALKTNTTVSPSVASCAQGMGGSPVVNSAVPIREELPADGQCVMNSVNKSLELQGVNERLNLELLEITQGKLIAKNPHARKEAYGCSAVGNRSFTMIVVVEALRKLLPGHNITLRNLCKKGKSKHAIESVASGGKGHFLIDGELDRVWYPDEDPEGDWRHMVLVEGSWMHETSGRAWTRYPVTDSTKRGSTLPTLFDKDNHPCYFHHIHHIYEFSVSPKA
jgi:hypothetical protein